MYEKFKERKPYALLDTSKYPPEVAGRFNSFITTQFDDSLTSEMQMRSIIKWAIDNFKHMDETYNNFTEHIIGGSINPFIEFLNDLIEYMNEFIDTFDERYQETLLNKMQEWYDNGELETLINDSLDTKYHEMDERLTTQLTQKVSKDEIKSRSESRGIDVVQDLLVDNSGELSITSIMNSRMQENETYFFPEGNYYLSSDISIPSRVTLIGHNAKIINRGFRLTGHFNRISGFEFIGDSNTTDHASIGVLLESGNHSTITNNSFHQARLYAGFNKDEDVKKNLKITNNTFTGSYGEYTGVSRPITILGYDSVLFTNNFVECETTESSALKIQAGTEIQGTTFNYIGENYTKNIVISHNIFKGHMFSSVSLYTGTGEAIITNNVFNTGSHSTPSNLVIDGKTSGASNGTVHTNKNRGLVISNNVIKGHYSGSVFRVQGGYGMEWEGDEQTVIMSNNNITNYHTGSVANIISVGGMHSMIFSNNDITYKNMQDNYHSTASVSGCRSILITGNSILTGGFTISNEFSNTIGDVFTGEIKSISITNNIIEKWINTGAVSLRNLKSNQLKTVITGNVFETDNFSAPQTFPINALNAEMDILITTSNIAINTANSIAGDKPMLNDSIISKHINANNTWNE